MKKMIAFFCFVFCFVSTRIAFSQELPLLDNQQQSFMPTDQSAVPEMTLPECKEKLSACGKIVAKMQNELDEANKKIAEKRKVKKQVAAANIAVNTADKVSKEAEKLPEEQKKVVQEKAQAVIQSTSANEALDNFEELIKEIKRVRDEILNRIKDLEAGQAAQDAKIDDHGKRLNELEKGFPSGYIGAKFILPFSYTAAGGVELGATVKVGSLYGPFKVDIGATVYGSEVKNLLGIEGRGIMTWVSEDLQFLKFGLGGSGGAMMDINNAGNVATAYGGGQFEIAAMYKRYEVYADFTLGGRDQRELTGEHTRSFFWELSIGARVNFGGPFEFAKK